MVPYREEPTLAQLLTASGLVSRWRVLEYVVEYGPWGLQARRTTNAVVAMNVYEARRPLVTAILGWSAAQSAEVFTPQFRQEEASVILLVHSRRLLSHAMRVNFTKGMAEGPKLDLLGTLFAELLAAFACGFAGDDPPYGNRGSSTS